MEGRVTEFVDHLHEHFETPVVIRNARYMAPLDPGYSIEIKADSRIRHRFPDGVVWA
jgi:L-fuconate dehydratase